MKTFGGFGVCGLGRKCNKLKGGFGEKVQHIFCGYGILGPKCNNYFRLVTNKCNTLISFGVSLFGLLITFRHLQWAQVQLYRM